MVRSECDVGRHLYDFAVISDTHVNPGEDQCNSPFAVNALANRRFRHVIADLNQRDISFVVHLGDLVHPVPETGKLYVQAAESYRTIAADLNVPIWHLPGNHDVGDTPIRGAPAGPTTVAMIADWSREFGEQYHAFSHKGVRFILLNAQLINSGLPDEAHQRQWVEAELSTTQERVILMLHHPVFLCTPDEPEHYDNINQPGRDWLLGLLAQHDVEAMFSGHAHNFWYDRIGTTDYYLAPATSFVRQDFSELQRSPPPDGSEHGRNDYAKLGYFIVRIFEKGNTVQFVRSFGAELYPGILAAPPRFLTRPPRENTAPCIGFDLRQNWAEICEVPPSGGLDEFDRKPVRNDYQILALIEMGVRDIRIPISDLRDPVRRLRLRALCHLGFRPTLFGFAIPNEADLALIEASRDYLFDWEITLDWPDLNRLRPDIARVHARMGLPIYLSRMRTEHDVPKGSVYHHVINHGFILEDTEQLNQLADLTEIGVSGAVFRLSTQLPVGTTLSEINTAATTRGLLASVHLRIADENPAVAHQVHETTCERVQKALEIMPALKATRLFCDTLADNDRGYFCRQGAIDRCGNPNPLLDIVRTAHRC